MVLECGTSSRNDSHSELYDTRLGGTRIEKQWQNVRGRKLAYKHSKEC